MVELLTRLVAWICARRRSALAIGSALGLVCLPFAALLYSNLRTQIEELLPRDAPSIVALEAMQARLGDNMQLGILVSGAPLDAIHRFLDRLAADSRALPNPPRFIDYRTDEVQRFFEPRKALFVDKGDLEKLEQRISERLARGAPALDRKLLEGDLFAKYQARASRLRPFPSGYYDADDGKSAAIILYPESKATSYEASLAFREAIDALARRIASESGLAGLRLEYTGDVEQMIQEQRSLQADLLVSSLLVIFCEALLLLAFFRWWPSVAVLGLPLAVASSGTFAIGWFLFGSLNGSSAFLGSIIVGNGVNPGIILLGRYAEERRRGVAAPEAMSTAVAETTTATVVASSAAAVAYGALMVTAFRGYSQFGVLGGVGMGLCWVATYLLVPPLALALDARWPVKPLAKPPIVRRSFERLGAMSAGKPVLFAVAGVVLTLVSTLLVWRMAADPFEEDMAKLRSSWATKPGGYLDVDRKIDGILKRYMTPAVVLLERAEEVEPLARRFREAVADNPQGLLSEVLTLGSLVPADQEAKLAILGRIRGMLEKAGPDRLVAREPRHRFNPFGLMGVLPLPPGLSGLEERLTLAALRWIPSEDVMPFGAADLPEYVRRQLREKDGVEGRMVLLFPKHGTNTANGVQLRQLASEIRAVPLPPGAQLAGPHLVCADLIASVRRDGPIATACAFAGVVLLSLLLARGARGGAMVVVALLTGIAWTCGLAVALGLRLNFLNFVALPITFGIGVDYAANVYGRYRLGKPSPQSAIQAVAGAGPAVALASATTVVGYSALLLSRNGALFSFGMLAVIGELCCLATALVLLPAMLAWRST
ncbi:MAG: MMPL family transporter [Deltaproteobacteria bacterium]|nr:MMPL family transporter [Deltaproteobacteria bacterium]